MPRKRSLVSTADRVLHIEPERAQSYLDMASALLVVLTSEGVVSLLNRAGRQVLEDPRGELVGANWLAEVVPSEERDAARLSLMRLLAEEDAVEHYEGEVVTRSGTRRRIAWQVTCLRDADGRRVAVLSGQDITERLRAEAATLTSPS